MNETDYLVGRERALSVLLSRGYSRAVAEDGVQSAALYFLERRYARVTPSLFTQYALRRAEHIREASGGSVRPHGPGRPTPVRVIGVGSTQDLAEFEGGGPAVCTGVEDSE